jgi:uncharacterized protein RhaS with RHS repeats
MVLTLFRAYDPALGRWLSPDPLGEAGGLNLYGYVGNDPLNAWDPLGLEVYVNARRLQGFGGNAGVHTFVEVNQKHRLCGDTKDTESRTTFGGYKDGDKLAVRMNDPSDAIGSADKGRILVPPPAGMTQSDWDQAVLNAGYRALGLNKKRDYKPFGGDGGNKSGNCNTTTKQIIEGAGGSIPNGFNPTGLNPGIGK